MKVEDQASHHYDGLLNRKVKVNKLILQGFMVEEIFKKRGSLKLITLMLKIGYRIKTGYVKSQNGRQNNYFIFYKK